METANYVPHPTPEAEDFYRRWIQFLDDEFMRHGSPERRSEIVRDQLHQLYLGRPSGSKSNVALTSELPGRVLEYSLDPENVTLEAQHYPEIDRERYNPRKPLLWFRHMFEHLGTGVKIYHGVDLTYGYSLSVGDGATIRQGALLNDRGGISIGKHAIVGSFSRIFSISHDAASYEKVRLARTVIGDRARVGSHAIVLAGQHVREGEAVGSFPEDRA